MILIRTRIIPTFHSYARVFCMLALVSIIGPSQAQQRVAPAVPLDARDTHDGFGGWHSADVVHLIGLPKMREKEKGSLAISPAALTFVSPDGLASVQRSEIRKVSVGDVNVETGGTAGKVTRAIIPFGGGSALATVTHKKLGLLTIEFRDPRGALHGAVFLLPQDEVLEAQQRLGEQTTPPSMKPTLGRCDADRGISPDTIQVAAIQATGDPVPAEYRMLIYEQLVLQLRDESKFATIYRDGDDQPEAACSRYHVVLTLGAFRKGNAALRASTGPVGFFVGATKLKVHLQVQDVRGRTVLDKELECSKRGDTDSLDITEKIAKTLTRQLKKADMHAAKA